MTVLTVKWSSSSLVFTAICIYSIFSFQWNPRCSTVVFSGIRIAQCLVIRGIHVAQSLIFSGIRVAKSLVSSGIHAFQYSF